MWQASQPPPVLPRTAEFLGRRVPVPSKEKSGHPQVARLVTVTELADRLADSHYGTYSIPLIRRHPMIRMRRIWQAIVNEAAQRGYETRVHEEGHGARLSATLVVVIGKDQYRVDLHGDTTTPLRLSIPGDDPRSSPHAEEWTNACGGPIEQRLGEVFTRIEQRAERAIERRDENLRRDEERHQQWNAAMGYAHAAYAEDHRSATIAQRIADIGYAQDIRGYCEALRARAADLPDPRSAEVLAWAQWAAQYAVSIDVRQTGAGMPATPDPKPEELKPYLGPWSPYGPYR
jgi:hypothetical protein